MSYIGKTPTIGNFQVCDAISVVNNQAAYTMQVGSVNVSPESANHMIVSLNGVIQKPTDAFTVSGSTITFASNLVTGDVINFIQILGNVLDLGVPSDNTVTTAKLSDSSVSLAKLTATGTKSSSTFLRGDNTFAEVPAGGITAADTWKPSATTSGAYANITSWTQDVTMGTGMSHSSGIFTFPSTGFWLITWFCTFNVNASTDYVKLRIRTTTSNQSAGDYNAPSFIYQGIDSGDTAHASGTLNYLFDVTNTSTHKIAFGSAEVQTGTLTMLGGAGTKATFVRLGDT